jgi:two-component system, NarL family, response regulator NreC
VNEMSIRILIADDHRLVREGLSALIAKQPGLEVVAEAEDGRTAVSLATKLKPDIVVMDISMPELNGIEATRRIIADVPGVKVIALSMYSDRKFVIEILGAGASGYILKDCAFTELRLAIKTVLQNQTYLSPQIADLIVDSYIRNRDMKDLLLNPLTGREKEVLQLISEGKNTKEIASILSLSVKTVETHRSNIMSKLKIYNIAELTKYALKEGIASL